LDRQRFGRKKSASQYDAEEGRFVAGQFSTKDAKPNE
jgi:hypothetical protein